jgi:pimeloyl-ACP methyl ester carboxylesterase
MGAADDPDGAGTAERRAGGTVLLLVPGILVSPRAFDATRRHLRSGAEVRVADTAARDTVEATAADAWALLADVPADATLVVCGYSMGGYVALRMLETSPRPIDGLALVCTSGAADSDETRALRARAVESIGHDFERHVSLLARTLLEPGGSAADASLVAAVRADMAAVGAAAGLRQQRAAGARTARGHVLRDYDGPVLVVSAEGDAVVPPARSDELAALARDAVHERIPRTGHLVPFEHPARLATGLDALVARARRRERVRVP